ncbi:MAG: Hsp70 family protein, partial [Vitreimonas sp.]
MPAAFELPQCEATRRAAQQAGLASSPLLQEPAAAALAYGFQSESEKVFWLVYDFGGGTFDAAVVQVRDGAITVINHAGDNQLGGKLIDWEIVERLLIPAARGQARLTDFRRGNPKWASAIAKLKYHAEQAKIRVSRGEATEIVIDFLCHNDGGAPVSFEYEMKRADVERLAEPYIFRSINICRRALAEKRLGAGVIEKALLVGGPTLMPYLRERLADPREGLGIPLEFGVDPMTVVARGAAIFAGTQRLEGVAPALSAGQYAVELEYSPVGEDPEPLVGGRARPAGAESLEGFTIEFVNAEARPPWRSGKIGLSPDGAFMTSLWAEKGRANHFLIELCDAAGVRRQSAPDRLSYTVGVVFTAPPLTHSVGVALADNEMEWLLLKGTPLPARRRAELRTAVELRRGQAGHALRIPVMEGRNQRADRNQHIGSLEVAADNIERDLPVGSEVEVTIEIDQSRLVRARAYIPLLDEEFEKVISYDGYRDQARDETKLAAEATAQKERLAQARERAASIGDEAARQSLRRIDT